MKSTYGNQLDRVLDWLALAAMLVGALSIVVMMVHVTVDVFLKSVFAVPIPMTLETVAHYYMVAVVFLPLAYVERKSGHIDVDFVMHYAPARLDRMARTLARVIGVLFFGVLAYRTGIVAIEKFLVGEIAMGSEALALWPSRFILPVGAGLYALVLFGGFFRSGGVATNASKTQQGPSVD